MYVEIARLTNVVKKNLVAHDPPSFFLKKINKINVFYKCVFIQ